MFLLLSGIGEEAVYRQAQRILDARPLPDVVRRDLAVALEAGRPGTLAFTHEAGLDAGLRGEDLLTRAAAVYFLACAVNVTDDLSDGDCSYLANAQRTGPCVQFMLQNLFFSAGLDAGLHPAALSAAVGDLIAAVAAQRVEIETETWNASVFRVVADGIGGWLFSAYLRVLWSGTWLESRAESVGRNIGRALIVWEDATGGDLRFQSMRPEDQRVVLAWALEAVEALRREDLRCLDYLLRPMEPALQALSETHGESPA